MSNKIVTKSIRIDETLLDYLYEKFDSKNFSDIIRILIKEHQNINSEIDTSNKVVLYEIDKIKSNQEIILNMINSMSLKLYENKDFFGNKNHNSSLNFKMSLSAEKERIEELIKSKKMIKKE